jgi:hypothetical protein
MRRPLFGTGIPKLLSGGSHTDLVMTLAGQTPELQSRVRGLTLWAMAPDGGNAQQLQVVARDNTSGAQTILLNETTGGSGFTTAKLLDRYPLRGDVEVVAAASGDASADPIYLYGYYQIEGERTIAREYRPLQPDLDSVQSNYIAANLIGDGIRRIHAFSPTSIDVVRLWAGGHPGAGTAELVVSDGTKVVAMKLDTGAGAPIRRVWDSLPAQVLEGVAEGLQPGVYLRTAGAGYAAAWGMFNRG